ncbi:MAG: hypothetical protein LBS55_00185 [Prevotellaceae bacterium]|jgi:hypothetical protein|nr:hypothetical protein [Prevotellaceae bacterium]
MNKFLIKTTIFTLLLTLILSAGLFLPATPRELRSSLFAIIQKDSLLINVNSPRMILIGGSNVRMGFDCQMIKDSLNVNPINMGLTLDTGIKYLFDRVIQRMKKGDIVIAPLEYHHFTRKYNYVSQVLLRIVMDVDKEYRQFLDVQQIINLFPYIPKYVASKLNPLSYFKLAADSFDINSFNQYGDMCGHWNMKKRNFFPYRRIDDFEQQVIEKIKEAERRIEKKGGRLYITYPSYLDESFYESEDIIDVIRCELEKNFKVLGTPERYMMPDSLMFDTSYHLNKKGVDIRTARLIEDIKKVMSDE